MDRFVPLSATTSSLGSHLAPDEEILTLQEHVGLYHGTAKAKRQADGTLYLSSHRIIYVDHSAPLYHSCALSLVLVRQTEYYAGFLKSSPKITLKLEPQTQNVLAHQHASPRRSKNTLGAGSRIASTSAASSSSVPRDWICPVCSYANTDDDKCALCGVSFLHSKARSPSTPTSTSTPEIHSDEEDDNEQEDDEDEEERRRLPLSDPAIEHVKLSFRKGGDRAFYDLLRTTLRQKAWQISHLPPSPARTRTVSTSAQPSPSTSSPARFAATDVALPPSSSLGSVSSVPSFATTIDIDGRRVPLSLLNRTGYNSSFPSSSNASSSSTPINADNNARSGAGIEAILRNTSLTHSQASSHMLDSLADLDALQKRAKGMVEMAEKLNAQLSRLEADERKARERNTTPGGGGGGGADTVDRDSATLIRSSLVMLGLPSPAVTEDMVAERSIYELELARELAGLLLTTSTSSSSAAPSRPQQQQQQQQQRSGLMGHGRVLAKGKERSVEEVRVMEQMEDDLRLLSRSNAAALVELVEGKMQAQGEGEGGERDMESILAEYTGEDSGRGMIGLDEVWCVWNRARGVALVPPSDLRACAVHLPRLTEPPIRLRIFPAAPSSSPPSTATKRTNPARSNNSGLCILHTPRYSESAFEARTLARLRFTRRQQSPSSSAFGSGLSAFELASREGAPVVLVEQMLSGLEMGASGSVYDTLRTMATELFPPTRYYKVALGYNLAAGGEVMLMDGMLHAKDRFSRTNPPEPK
ncbi:unnamed protein product [Tilletia caries]|nr:unnamed protein product [Tilletia caries]